MEQAKAIALALVIALTNPIMADCPNNVQPIHKGESAVCDGFLFSDEAEKDAATAREDAAYYHKLTDKLTVRSKFQEDENTVLEQRLKLYMDATSNLSKDVASRESTDSLYRYLYFGLGCLVTGVIAVNVRR